MLESEAKDLLLSRDEFGGLNHCTERQTPMKYIIIEDDLCLELSTREQITKAKQALQEADLTEADVWVTPYNMHYIREHGDPDGYKTGEKLLAGTRCAYCDRVVIEESTVPDHRNDSAWEFIAKNNLHTPDCEWVTTRAHRRDT